MPPARYRWRAAITPIGAAGEPAAAPSAVRRTFHACQRWRRSCAASTWTPVARLNRIQNTKGFGTVSYTHLTLPTIYSV